MHRFPELRIRFVRDDDYVWKQPYLVEFAVVEMQCSECDNLKYPRLLNQHRGRVALRLPPLAVRAGGDVGGPMGIVREAKAKNQFTEHRRQMARAVLIAEWNLVNSGTRFTRLSHSLMVGSSSRSSMAATLSDFSFILRSRPCRALHK